MSILISFVLMIVMIDRSYLRGGGKEKKERKEKEKKKKNRCQYEKVLSPKILFIVYGVHRQISPLARVKNCLSSVTEFGYPIKLIRSGGYTYIMDSVLEVP